MLKWFFLFFYDLILITMIYCDFLFLLFCVFQNSRLDFYIDIHAHSTLTNGAQCKGDMKVVGETVGRAYVCARMYVCKFLLGINFAIFKINTQSQK